VKFFRLRRIFGEFGWHIYATIIKNTKLSAAQRFAMVSDALFPRVIPMDFVVKTPREVSQRLSGFDPFLMGIMKRGKVLYEKNFYQIIPRQKV
jgi:hypothetical protein